MRNAVPVLHSVCCSRLDQNGESGLETMSSNAASWSPSAASALTMMCTWLFGLKIKMVTMPGVTPSACSSRARDARGRGKGG